MIAESLLSLLGGGTLRLIPEVIKFFDRKDERKHELSLMQAQMELKKLEAQNQLALEHEKHEAGVDMGLLQAYTEAIRGQESPSGVPWVDALSKSVRPILTYSFFGLYAIVRVASLVAAFKSNDQRWYEIVKSVWTVDDAALLAGVTGFWFVNRIPSLRR